MKVETPLERYDRRTKEEFEAYEKYYKEKLEEIRVTIKKELTDAEGKCNPCIDNGGMFEGFCIKCGVSFG